MSRISTLLAQILSAVYGRDVRQSIHDAIEQCYADVSEAKTLSEDATASANQAAVDAESQVSAAISDMQVETNIAVANCNAAVAAANTAVIDASAKADSANQAAIDVRQAFDDLGLEYVDGKLCVKVERS